MLVLLQLLLCVSVCQGTTLLGSGFDRSDVLECPPWFIAAEDQSGSSYCECGDQLSGVVRCSTTPPTIAISPGSCMTYSRRLNATLVGSCPYNYIYGNTSELYLSLPTNISELNEEMCGLLNREGVLCGKCKNGYHPAVNSLDNSCVKCVDSSYNWLLFVAVTLLPTTIFFIIVMFVRVNVNAPPLSALVLVCQLMATPELVTSALGTIDSVTEGEAPLVILKTMFALFGIWNLDFMDTLIPSFCLPGVNNSIKALSVMYAVAFYPLLLVTITFICIELHAHNFKPIVVAWKPFHKCFVKLKRTWNVKDSVINAFATFLLLSYWKVTYVSFSLLDSIQLYSPSGESVGSRYFLYDASVQAFHGEHLPFAVLAIGIIAVFVVLPPLILCLYPTKVFQRCLWFLHIRGHKISAFMDVFQGCYKNGMEGSRDWRFMSGFYFVLRILVMIVASITGTLLRFTAYPVAIVLFVSSALLLAIVRPYKKDIHGIFDSLILAVFSLMIFLFLLGEFMMVIRSNIPLGLVIVWYIVISIPLVCFAAITTMWLVKRQQCFQCSYKDCLIGSTTRPMATDLELPYRLTHPNN